MTGDQKATPPKFDWLFRCLLFKALPFTLVCWVGVARGQIDERIWMDATINGKPARLIFDTGASHFILFAKGAARLGLSFTNAPQNVVPKRGQVPGGQTEECNLVIGGTKIRTSLGIITIPSMLPLVEDGVVGWGPVSDNIIVIDGLSNAVTYLTKVPLETAGWIKLKLQTNSNILRLEWPSQGGKRSNIAVDTGSPYGAKLSPEKWRTWRAAHTNRAPRTLVAYHAPYSGLVVAEEGWAKELSFGPFSLADLPVTQADTGDVALGSTGYEATLGLWALKRMILLIDGKQGMAYLKPRTTSPPAYEHNRLGAVFTPADLQGSDDLIAHVVNGSPAYEAGVRSGDLLLKIGELDVTKWRIDPAVLPLTRFWARPAGTELALTLKRAEEELKVNAVLRQILSPDQKSAVEIP